MDNISSDNLVLWEFNEKYFSSYWNLWLLGWAQFEYQYQSCIRLYNIYVQKGQRKKKKKKIEIIQTLINTLWLLKVTSTLYETRANTDLPCQYVDLTCNAVSIDLSPRDRHLSLSYQVHLSFFIPFPLDILLVVMVSFFPLFYICGPSFTNSTNSTDVSN